MDGDGWSYADGIKRKLAVALERAEKAEAIAKEYKDDFNEFKDEMVDALIEEKASLTAENARLRVFVEALNRCVTEVNDHREKGYKGKMSVDVAYWMRESNDVLKALAPQADQPDTRPANTTGGTDGVPDYSDEEKVRLFDKIRAESLGVFKELDAVTAEGGPMDTLQKHKHSHTTTQDPNTGKAANG